MTARNLTPIPACRQFAHHRQAALALLSKRPDLRRKDAGFLGHVCVAVALTDRQRGWLADLLAASDLPPLVDGET
jgi:hypothetical protein